MNYFKFAALIGFSAVAFTSCNEDNNGKDTPKDLGEDAQYYKSAVGNFTAEEWLPGGELGTTDNVTESSYQDATPAVEEQGLDMAFNFGEQIFERTYNQNQPPFNGLGPAWVRQACITCHPAYGHGKRQNDYKANTYGNGYLLVIFDKDTEAFCPEVTGMPQTKAAEPFKAPIDEDQIKVEWKVATDGDTPLRFPDGETYELIYPEVTIPQQAFNTDPKPSNYAVRIESTIGIPGTGLLDAIPEADIKAQYAEETSHGAQLNPAIWTGSDWNPTTGLYTLADGTKAVKRYTYGLTRASLQDGPGANAVWNITNVTRGDRTKLYTTEAWALAMSEDEEVIRKIQADPTSPYYADGTVNGIKNAIRVLLSPKTDQTNNSVKRFDPEMADEDFYNLMVWHRGLAIPRARGLQRTEVQRGKELFYQMGCTNCHRPSWKTGSDDYWAPENIKKTGKLPKYANQTIYPYSDLIQHRLFMKNDIRTGWCRTTPLWGRGLSLINTGAEGRLHDVRARNEVEAIMWHCYSKKSDAYNSAMKFYNLPKADRDAVVEFLRAI